MQKVALATTKGLVFTDADIVGSLAVHQALGNDGSYVISHVYTGQALFAFNRYGGDLTWDQAMDLAQRMACQPLRWHFAPWEEDALNEFRSQVKEWCKSQGLSLRTLSRGEMPA